ncbi:hypothetical protein VP01_896g3 [Puccinia sorghi]|uniref:Uncharacterized protein n=1 Tax=Puccinia sorghi TaxID=27349 RepID=A0A0L6UA22_9BASI|nr:hypothetical protein VP01_896g3 [Puccinia sorghi]
MALWKEIAIRILILQKPTSGSYPRGYFQSSSNISANFLSNSSKEYQNERLICESMLFLNKLIMGVLSSPPADGQDEEDMPDIPNNVGTRGDDPQPLKMEGIHYTLIMSPQARATH